MHDRNENDRTYKTSSENLTRRHDLGNLAVALRVILKLISEKQCVRMWTRLMCHIGNRIL
jgi:hypothetical protein